MRLCKEAHISMKRPSASGRREREAQLLQALAHPVRLQILELVQDGELCTCEIEPHIALDQSTVSRHLQILKRAGILAARKDGTKSLYRLRDPRIPRLQRLVGEFVTARAQEELAALTVQPPAGAP
jgi:ArsR family transcriptional regulator